MEGKLRMWQWVTPREYCFHNEPGSFQRLWTECSLTVGFGWRASLTRVRNRVKSFLLLFWFSSPSSMSCAWSIKLGPGYQTFESTLALGKHQKIPRIQEERRNPWQIQSSGFTRGPVHQEGLHLLWSGEKYGPAWMSSDIQLPWGYMGIGLGSWSDSMGLHFSTFCRDFDHRVRTRPRNRIASG